MNWTETIDVRTCGFEAWNEIESFYAMVERFAPQMFDQALTRERGELRFKVSTAYNKANALGKTAFNTPEHDAATKAHSEAIYASRQATLAALAQFDDPRPGLQELRASVAALDEKVNRAIDRMHKARDRHKNLSNSRRSTTASVARAYEIYVNHETRYKKLFEQLTALRTKHRERIFPFTAAK